MESNRRSRKSNAQPNVPRLQAEAFSRRRLLSLILASSVLSGCDMSRRKALRLGCNSWLGYAPLYYARDKGLLATDAVRLVEIPTNSGVQRALRNQNIELAALTLDEAIRVHADGVPCKILWVADISTGGDAIISQPGFRAIGDLRGKVIGVEDTALGAYVLKRALDIHKMSIDHVTIRRLTPSEQEAAFEAGVIDAVVTFEPFLGRLRAKGGTVLFSSREIPWEIIDVIVARADIAQEQEEALTALAEAWFSVLDEIVNRSPNLLQHLARREQQSPDSIAESLNGIHFPRRREILSALESSYGLEQNINRLIAFQSSRDPFMNSFPAHELVDLSLCQRLLGGEA